MITLAPFHRSNGSTSTTFTMDVEGKKVKVWCFDDRIAASVQPTSYDIAGDIWTLAQLEARVAEIQAKTDEHEDDPSSPPPTQEESDEHKDIITLLDKRKAPFRLWAHPNSLPANTGLSCALRKCVDADGNPGLYGVLKLCPLKKGDKLDKYGNPALITDYSKEILSWAVTTNLVNRVPVQLTLTETKKKEKQA